MGKYDEQIQTGMALLDEKAPGWERRIDLDHLHLGDCMTCVLGYVFGSFHAGLGTLRTEIYRREVWRPAEDFGFNVSNGSPGRYGALTRAWKRAIRARLADQARPSTTGQGEGA